MSSRSKVEAVDRLINLPKDTLLGIFSELDIEEVVRTSILSKQWRYFWTCHPSLTFRLQCTSLFSSASPENFDDHVSKVVSAHKSCNKTEFFSLHAFGTYPKTRIHSYLSFIVYKKRSCCYDKPSFDPVALRFSDCNSASFSACKTLTVLQLGTLNIRNKWFRLELPPPTITIPCLQELHLQDLDRLNTDFLHSVFVGCPVLETLRLSNCVFDQSRNLLISSTQLNNLVIANCTALGYDLYYLTVSAPNLVSFSCTDYGFNDYHLDNLSSLETVNLEIRRSYNQHATKEEYANRMIKFLQGIYNVKFLTLSSSSVKEISKALDLLQKLSLLFDNLRHLKVTTEINEEYLQAIMYMLETSPGVETLVMDRIEGETSSVNIAEGFPLQHVKFIEVDVLSEDLKFVKILLKKAINLEKITIISKLKPSADQLEGFTDELKMCPRASPAAQVIVL